MKAQVKESQIEDILATYPDILKEILDLRDDITLIARQKTLPSGNRIDLLFISGRKIILIELKVENFRRGFLKQIEDYIKEIRGLQDSGRFIGGEVESYILCPGFSERERVECESRGTHLVRYSPQKILETFFLRFRNLADFITLRPSNHGLWNIHLLNRVLYLLEAPKTSRELSRSVGISESTVQSYMSLARELLLVRKHDKLWSLTEVGKKFVWNRDPSAPDRISEEQSAVLQDVIVHNPFASGAIFGIYTIVESVFNLSRNTYPIPEELLTDHFKRVSGRHFEWTSNKTARDSMRMYTNYSIDLGLIGKVGDKFYLTPAGVRFILLLDLHKAIKIVDALGISKQA